MWILFCFLTGNEDMHLKNFSLITRNGRVELSPAYDLLNTSLVLGKTEDELALMLAGKRHGLRRRELIEYFGMEKLGLPNVVVMNVLQKFEEAKPLWFDLLKRSFIAEDLKNEYQKIIAQRFSRLT